MDWDRTEVSRRVQAVMALGGYRSAETFAEKATAARGVGLKRLRQLIQQKGDEPRAVELREIADACGLPYAFFTTVDFAELDGASDVRVDRLEQAVTDAGKLIAALQTSVDELNRWRKQVDAAQDLPDTGRTTGQARNRRRRDVG